MKEFIDSNKKRIIRFGMIKNLFVLRWYSIGLRFLAELILLLYLSISISHAFSNSKNMISGLIYSGLGISIVLGSLGLIFLSQLTAYQSPKHPKKEGLPMATPLFSTYGKYQLLITRL